MARLDTEELGLQLEGYMSPLYKTLSEEGKRKLANILKFWDDLKGKWAEARKKFWSKYDRDQFLLQLRHAEKKREELINTNQQKLEEIWFFTRWKKKQEKFTAEYLKALSLYEEIVESPKQKEERITWEEVQKTGFREWVTVNLIAKEIWAKAIVEAISNMELKERVTLNLAYNEIWVEWAKALAKIELKEWVRLDLRGNNIWVDWAEGIAKNLKLKEWMSLDLSANDIWAKWAEAISKMELKEWVTLELVRNRIRVEWAKAIAKNLKLKEWVTLDLSENIIWSDWAEAISKMELKEWVRLDLRWNNIWDKSRSTLENWVADAKARGINCEVLV